MLGLPWRQKLLKDGLVWKGVSDTAKIDVRHSLDFTPRI